jgi:hypothetical protein
MFEFGKQYSIRLYADGEDRRIHGIITAAEGGLIKFSTGENGDMVINTGSAVFVSATLLDEPESAPKRKAFVPDITVSSGY